MKDVRIRHRLSAVAVAVATALPAHYALAQVTYFSVDSSNATTGVMSLSTGTLGSSTLSAPAALTIGSNPFNYATVYFVPAAGGSIKFGQTAAPVDTVMILYSGTFNAANPGAGAIVGNDDTSQATHRTTVGNPSLNTMCGSASYCPQVTATVTAGQTYSVLISTYSSGDPLGLPLSFYATGAGSFFATATNVYSAANSMGNSPALPAARVIDANSNLLALFSGLTTNPQLSGAASQTLPLLTGGSMIAVNAAFSGINKVIQARIESNLGISAGDGFFGDKNLWMKPFGSWTDQETAKSVAGYKANTYGAVIGIDGVLSRAFRVGGAFAYAKSDINMDGSVATQSNEVDIYQLIGYGSYSLDERTEINFQVDYGQNSNKGRRSITLTSSVASSDYDSEAAHIGVGIGRTFALSSQTSITPSARADYTWIKDKAYSESGAGLLSLNVNERSAESFVVGLDGKVSHKLNDATSLFANLGVGYDAINSRATITSAFAGAPGAAFVTYGIDPSPWLGRAGVGAAYKLKNGLEITGRYDTEYRENFLNQTASVKVRWAF